jgi:hypothetical protein
LHAAHSADGCCRAAAQTLARWALLVAVMLEALGACRLRVLGEDLATERAHRGLRALLDAAGLSTAQHAALREPLALAAADA